MKILLIGHEGYLGSRLLEYFQETGHDVVGYGRSQDLLKVSPSFMQASGVEIVVNCATAANRIDSRYEVGGRDEEVNVFGVRQLALALAETEIGLIHISTKDVYGDVYRPEDVSEFGTRLEPAFAISERQPLRPSTIYAKTKLMGEFIAEAHARTTIIRLSSGYTSCLHHRGNWILHFCRATRDGRLVRISGCGKQLRDPLHADDLGNLILRIAEQSAWGLTLNAGGGMGGSYSVLEVLEMIKAGARREYIPGGGDLGYVTNNTMAENAVGWKPARSFSEELATLIERVASE